MCTAYGKLAMRLTTFLSVGSTRPQGHRATGPQEVLQAMHDSSGKTFPVRESNPALGLARPTKILDLFDFEISNFLCIILHAHLLSGRKNGTKTSPEIDQEPLLMATAIH